MSIAAALVAVVALQGPTIEMSILSNDREIGKAWLSQRLDSAGKKTYAKLIIGDIKIVETAHYKPDGTPISKTSIRTEAGKDLTTEATFADGKVTFKSPTGTTTVPFPATGIRALSELWFLQTKPPLNHTVTYQRFDLNQGKFVPCKVVYQGKESIRIGDKTFSAHKVRIDDKTEAWLDERGDPYRMVIEGATRFERVGQ